MVCLSSGHPLISISLYFSTESYNLKSSKRHDIFRLKGYTDWQIRRVSEVVEMPLMVDQYVSGVSTHDDA